MTELWQLYDEQGLPMVDEGGTKEDVYNDALLHGASHIWIWRKHDGKVQILLQKRAAKKKVWPNHLDISAAGHIDLGEDPLSAAVRETKEEIGLDVQATDLELVSVLRINKVTPNNLHENEFCWMYLLEMDSSEEMVLQKEEVESVAWKDFDEFQSDINNLDTYKKYVPQGGLHYSTLISFIKYITIK